MSKFYIYILSSKSNSCIYIGVTNNLKRRVFEHKQGKVSSFTKKYNVHKLVYFEAFESIIDAIQREKRLKKWNREWKNKLINESNPDWEELYDTLE